MIINIKQYLLGIPQKNVKEKKQSSGLLAMFTTLTEVNITHVRGSTIYTSKIIEQGIIH